MKHYVVTRQKKDDHLSSREYLELSSTGFPVWTTNDLVAGKFPNHEAFMIVRLLNSIMPQTNPHSYSVLADRS